MLKNYFKIFSSTLLITTVFDREVNCRRAASAAFQVYCFSVSGPINWYIVFSIQENVGRQGQFPYGIDILTKADYYAVGNRTTCYLNLSVFVAQFSEYTEPLITHLLDYKFNHWDQEVRELTSQALFNLTAVCPEYMSGTILNLLLKQCLHFDLNTRHGALLSLSQIIHALCEFSREKSKPKSDYFSDELIKSLKALLSQVNVFFFIQNSRI